MSAFCRDISHAEINALYHAAKAEYRREHPAPEFGDDDELRFLYSVDSANAGDNAVNEACGDPTRHPTDQHLRYLREQRRVSS